ncbi:hypothetical protein GH714_033733 [Hevea brasiliensis]|uniref:Uncharacterized protein n=1 Tax=Hevea brasiliensis TaxID=3981 RepID=A0A6A6N934_HEVBR|nr:hypothetical protein GH714_033733 [Hevea brasiliensis]
MENGSSFNGGRVTLAKSVLSTLPNHLIEAWLAFAQGGGQPMGICIVKKEYVNVRDGLLGDLASQPILWDIRQATVV